LAWLTILRSRIRSERAHVTAARAPDARASRCANTGIRQRPVACFARTDHHIGPALHQRPSLTSERLCKWPPTSAEPVISASAISWDRRAFLQRHAQRDPELQPHGPVNGKPSWYNPDDNNFGPRFALAYSPKDRGGFCKRSSVTTASFARAAPCFTIALAAS